jgi:hypothetical protein
MCESLNSFKFLVIVIAHCRALMSCLTVSYVVVVHEEAGSLLFQYVHCMNMDNVFMWICVVPLMFIAECDMVYEDLKLFIPFKTCM